jgi:hypothetical protein
LFGFAIAAAALAAACGSRTGLNADVEDDAGLPDGGGDATLDQSLDAPDAHDASDEDAEQLPDVLPDVPIIAKCIPRSCGDQGFGCGLNGDGCGAIINCGTCPPLEVCGAQAYSQCAVGPPCVPKTCNALGFNCGAAGDGCGGTLNCGICQYPDACGAAGVPGHCGNSLPCTNLCLKQVACDAGTTTVTGTVVAGTLPQYGAADPIYNALVYVPNAPVAPFAPGVTCNHCGAEVTGEPLVVANTAADGTFTLTNVPAGANIPLVIQLGRWRRVVTIPNVAACGTTVLPRDLTRMPRNQGEGDIPKMAIATGNADGIECVLMKTGIDQAEFTQPSSSGRVHMYVANGATAGSGTPPASQLWSSPATLARYDMVLLPCESTAIAKAPSDQQNIIDFTSAGGRVFATHYSYTWLYNIAPFSTTASFNTSTAGGNSATGVVDTAFANGQALSTWLGLVGALSGPNQFPVDQPRYNINSVAAPAAQRFVYDQGGSNLPFQYAFYTPVAVPPAQQCGRVVYSTFHVVSAVTGGTTFPAACVPGPMTAQEKNLEFMLFDLANCIPAVPQNCTPLSCQQQGISCGPAGDGCGTPINCGPCTVPQTCGGDTNFQCGVPDAGTCVPKTCGEQGFDCGSNGDGCGNVISCGTCTLPQVCGGGGKSGVCGGP